MSTWKRSFAKTLTYKIITVTETILVTLLFTGNLKLATSIGVVCVISKVITYLFHERIWSSISWGQVQEEHIVVHLNNEQAHKLHDEIVERCEVWERENN